jgi:hypothetical protein
MSRDSSVGIALGYGLDDRGSRVRFSAGAGNFSLHHHVQNGSGAHPASYRRILGALSLGIKRSGCEADHSPPSIAEVKNEWSYTSTPQYVFMAWCLVKHRDNFAITFIFTFYLFILNACSVHKAFFHICLAVHNACSKQSFCGMKWNVSALISERRRS